MRIPSFVVIACLVTTIASAQPAATMSMLSTQKMLLTVGGFNSAGVSSTVPQTQTLIVWSSNCVTCTFIDGGYDVAAKVWKVWFNAGATEYGKFLVNLQVEVTGFPRLFDNVEITINEPIVAPASVKIITSIAVDKTSIAVAK